MKKIFSLLIAVTVFWGSTAFADCFDFMKETYTSFEAEFDMSIDVDSDLEVLNTIPGMEYARKFVDVEGLVKGLSESEYTGNVKFSANDKFTRMQASFEMFSKVPIKVNKNLKITTEAVYGIWVDCDITDENEPKIDYIYASPVFDKYLYIDMVSLFEDEGKDISEFITLLKSMTGEEGRKEITDKMVEILKNNSSAEENGLKVTITLTNDQLKEFVLQVFDFAKEKAQVLYEADDVEMNDIDEAFSTFSEGFEKMHLFADDAIVIEVTKNPNGTIRNEFEKINFEIDLGSVFEAFGGTLVTDSPGVIKYSLSESFKYSNVNQRVDVKLPVLTNSNSINFDEFINNSVYMPDPDWDGENCLHEENAYLYGKYIPTDAGGVYCSVNDFADRLSRYGYEFDIKTEDNLVTLTEKSGLDRFTEAKISLDSPAVWVDGEEYSADSKAILSGKEICVDFKTLELIFGFLPSSAAVYLESNTFSAYFTRKSPQCHHSQEVIDSYTDSEYDYCDHFQYIYTREDRLYRGKPYFILRYAVGGLFDYDEYDESGEYIESSSNYELSYDNGVVTLVDICGNEDFNTVIFTNGSNEINIDGNIFYAENPVEIENGTTYVDFSTIKAIFGAEISYQTLQYENGYFDEELGINVPSGFVYNATLTRRLPTCTHEDVEPYKY